MTNGQAAEPDGPEMNAHGLDIHTDGQPTDPDYVVLTEKLEGDIFEWGGLAAGTHKFKLIGINSAGFGPESDEIVLPVT